MKLTGLAREDLEANGLLSKNRVYLIHNGNEKDGIPDVYGEMIGRKNLKTGKLESCWKKDKENGNTYELEKILKVANVYEKHRNLRNFVTMECSEAIDYFVLYDIQESSKLKPTVTEDYITCCMNGSWKCEYELLFTYGDNATRRIVIPYQSVNIGMVEWLTDIEDEVEAAMDGDEESLFYGIIKTCDDDEDERSIMMYDEIGYPCDVPIESVSDFINMIVSVRCISCEFIENKQ